MSLDASDIATIGPAATALVKEIAAALHVDGDGGKVVTRAEAKRIISLTGRLLVTLISDIID